MRVVLLGAPGSGKGTQAKLLMDEHQVPQVSTGDLLREAIRNKTPLGAQARAAMESGQLVPNEVVLGIIASRLADDDTGNGFVLDGFPRNIDQARALDDMLSELGKPLQLAIMLEVDADILLQRLTGRRTCSDCNAVYNVYTSPSKIEDRCDYCGEVLKHRPDDNESTIEQRLRIFQVQTRPLIAYYREQRKLRTIQAIGDINDIYAGIKKITSQIDQMPVADLAPATPVDQIVYASSIVVTEPLPPAVLPEVIKKQTKVNAKKEAANDDGADTPKKMAPKKKIIKKPEIKKPNKQVSPKKKATIKKTIKNSSAAKKKVAKKMLAKKTAAKKTVLKKKVAKKKLSPKKSVIKKAAKKKISSNEKLIKKKVIKKNSVKKAPVKKTVKKSMRKAAPKKVTPKKTILKNKSAKKKSPARNVIVKKTAKKKQKTPAAKKTVAKKRGRR